MRPDDCLDCIHARVCLIKYKLMQTVDEIAPSLGSDLLTLTPRMLVTLSDHCDHFSPERLVCLDSDMEAQKGDGKE